MRPRQMQCQTILHRCLPLRAARHSLSAAQEKLRCSLRIQKRRSSAVPLCKLRTWQERRPRQQNIHLLRFLRDPIWQEIRLCRTAAHRQLPHKTARQENSQILIPHGRSNRATRRMRQRPVRQERSAHLSAGVIPSLCSRQRAFPQMGIPRSRSKIMFLPSSPTARHSRPAEPAWRTAPQIGSIPHPQRRYLLQRRLPTTKLVHPRVRPRGPMRRVQQNNVFRSAQFPRKAAAQKSWHCRMVHMRLLPLHLLIGRAESRLLWAP